MSDPWGQQQQPGGEWSSPQGSQGGSESGSFGPPPVNPQYGAPPQQQPQYGAPQPTYGEQPQYGEQAQYGAPPQQPYDQSQYGAAPPPYGGQVPPAGGYGYPMPPQPEQKNGFSVAGLILSILPLLGIIFSILGLTRAAKIGGKGRGLAIAGLVLSLAFAGGYSALLIAASHSTALDPGCTSAEASFRSVLSKIQADESKLSADETSSDQNAMQSDLGAFTNDVQGIKTSLDSALGQAQHQSVKDKIQAMDTDINTVLTGLQAIEKGDTSQITQFTDAAGRLGSDGDALDNLCSSL